MGLARKAARGLVPLGLKMAPQYAQYGAGTVRTLAARAIEGAGRFRGAAAVADDALRDAGGDRERAISALVETHERLAGAQGFVTNLGGLVTLPVAVPANLTGLTLLQCHLVATIAHVQGYALSDQRVRNAILACLLGRHRVHELMREGRLPSTPMGLATAPVHDPALDDVIAGEVAAELLSRVGGRRVVTTVGRRVPLLGGGIGAVSDGWSTHKLGSYARKELRPRG